MLTCKICIARYLVVNFFQWCSVNYGLSRANTGGTLNYESGEFIQNCFFFFMRKCSVFKKNLKIRSCTFGKITYYSLRIIIKKKKKIINNLLKNFIRYKVKFLAKDFWVYLLICYGLMFCRTKMVNVFSKSRTMAIWWRCSVNVDVTHKICIEY